MSEYIEREAANEVCRECVRKYPNSFYNGIEAVRSELRKLPAADVRPVVTCADCKYNEREVTDLLGNNAIQCITGKTHRRDWFCAGGEKREES